MNTYLGISESLSVTELVPEAIEQSEWLYVEGYLVTSDSCRQAAIRSREIAELSGVKTALSFSDPGMVEFFRDGMQEMLGEKGVDLLFCNEVEALTWGNSDSMEEAVAGLKQVARQFAVTLGARGALLYDGEKLIELMPAPWMRSIPMVLVTCLPVLFSTPSPMVTTSGPPASSPAWRQPAWCRALDHGSAPANTTTCCRSFSATRRSIEGSRGRTRTMKSDGR